MKQYKVCVATSKHIGKVISSLTRVFESDEYGKDYSLENERYYFDYYFFQDKEKAEDFLNKKREENNNK